MGVKVREKRGKLYLDIYYNGRRSWEALKLSVPKDAAERKEVMRLAEKIRLKREMQLASSDYGLPDPVAAKTTLIAYAEQLAQKSGPKDALPKSLKYLREFSGEIRLKSVSERFLEEYQEFLLAQDSLGANTAAKYYSALVQVLNSAVRKKLISESPAKAVKGLKTREKPKMYLSIDEVRKLSATKIGGALGAEVRRAFLFACYTGLRVGDLKALRWEAIDLCAPRIYWSQQKTGEVASVFLHPSALALIKDDAEHGPSEQVFPLLAASRTNTNQYLVRWAKDAGVPKQLGWHVARHTFAMWTLDNGSDVYTVSKLLGHTKIATTAVYAKPTDSMKRKAISALPEL